MNTAFVRASVRSASLLCSISLSIFALSACSERPVQVGVGAHDKVAGSVVRVNVAGGHGSGVALEGGIVITAAHVAKGNVTVQLVLSDGSAVAAEVLWINEKYDVAALAPVEPLSVGVKMACRASKVGEAVVAAGSPGIENNLFIPGSVVGAERKSGWWEKVILTNTAATGGISGGPLFDAQGDVLGIVVGGQIGVAGATGDQVDLTSTGIAYVVPSSAICMMLGREMVIEGMVS